MIIFDIGAVQIAPEQMLWPIPGWYTEEVMWAMFYQRLEVHLEKME